MKFGTIIMSRAAFRREILRQLIPTAPRAHVLAVSNIFQRVEEEVVVVTPQLQPVRARLLQAQEEEAAVVLSQGKVT
jgi:hypothetical protein